MSASRDWMDDALCAQTFGNWFADDIPQNRYVIAEAKKICNMCEVKTQCAQFALENHENFGIWGGLSPHALKKLRRVRRIPPPPPESCCGSDAGLKRHYRAGQTPCNPCSGGQAPTPTTQHAEGRDEL